MYSLMHIQIVKMICLTTIPLIQFHLLTTKLLSKSYFTYKNIHQNGNAISNEYILQSNVNNNKSDTNINNSSGVSIKVIQNNNIENSNNITRRDEYTHHDNYIGNHLHQNTNKNKINNNNSSTKLKLNKSNTRNNSSLEDVSSINTKRTQ